MDDLRIIVAEEQRLTGLAVAAVIASLSGVRSTTLANDVRQVARQSDDGAELLVVGLRTKDPSWALALLEELRSLRLPLLVLLLQDQADAAGLATAMAMGAHGACLVTDGVPALEAALQSVAAGRVTLPAGVLGQVLVDLRHAAERTHDDMLLLQRLTDREAEVLALLASGLGRGAIAATLGISYSTARSHVQRVLRKLSVHSQLHAAAEGRRLLAGARPALSAVRERSTLTP